MLCLGCFKRADHPVYMLSQTFNICYLVLLKMLLSIISCNLTLLMHLQYTLYIHEKWKPAYLMYALYRCRSISLLCEENNAMLYNTFAIQVGLHLELKYLEKTHTQTYMHVVSFVVIFVMNCNGMFTTTELVPCLTLILRCLLQCQTDRPVWTHAKQPPRVSPTVYQVNVCPNSPSISKVKNFQMFKGFMSSSD